MQGYVNELPILEVPSLLATLNPLGLTGRFRPTVLRLYGRDQDSGEELPEQRVWGGVPPPTIEYRAGDQWLPVRKRRRLQMVRCGETRLEVALNWVVPVLSLRVEPDPDL